MNNVNYWQIAAGSDAGGRNYAKEFLDFGMAFVGGVTQIATMANVKAGDRVIIKVGRTKIIAVGEVVERNGRVNGNLDKAWLRDFDGWDLSAYCYVRWHKPKLPHSTTGLTRATIQLAHKRHLKDLAEDILSKIPPLTDIKPEPVPTKKIEDEEILRLLIREGLRPAAADDLTKAFHRIRRLANYYYWECNWADVREHETRTFLIVPLLLALGWAEQQIKIELPCRSGKIDVACFSKPYGLQEESGKSNNTECVLILESKGFTQGLRYAQAQASGYAKQFSKCKVVVVSNGYCYKAFRRDENLAFPEVPYAYLNLLNPQDAYPLDPKNVKGCLEVLKLLLPASFVR